MNTFLFSLNFLHVLAGDEVAIVGRKRSASEVVLSDLSETHQLKVLHNFVPKDEV
jgi:hypothetical protein